MIGVVHSKHKDNRSKVFDILQGRQATAFPISVSNYTASTFYLLTFIFMSETKLNLLVVAVRPNHPSGKRNRAGITFTTEATVYEVTKDQEATIREDQFLRIIERGTALDDAMTAYMKNGGTLGSKQAPKAQKTEDLPPPPPPAELPPVVPPVEGESGTKDPADIPPVETTIVPPVETEGKPISRMSKVELIAGLEAKGMKSGTDFQPEATNKDLAALLSSF